MLVWFKGVKKKRISMCCSRINHLPGHFPKDNLILPGLGRMIDDDSLQTAPIQSHTGFLAQAVYIQNHIRWIFLGKPQ
ncbi:MAG: hypothetical protein GY950_26635 [bacterium]|nr:hypothetical protein [bacterium]